MTVHIDKPKALELLEQAVAERGETYIDRESENDNCRYRVSDTAGNDQPGCIVGLALHKAGVSFDDLQTWDDDVSGLSGINDPSRCEFPGVDLDEAAFWVFREAQVLQDKGEPWGAALEAAKRVDA